VKKVFGFLLFNGGITIVNEIVLKSAKKSKCF